MERLPRHVSIKALFDDMSTSSFQEALVDVWPGTSPGCSAVALVMY
jgi:hypothetical protein